MQRTAKHAAKIEPLIARGLHPHCGPAAGKPESMMKSYSRCAISAFCLACIVASFARRVRLSFEVASARLCTRASTSACS